MGALYIKKPLSQIKIPHNFYFLATSQTIFPLPLPSCNFVNDNGVYLYSKGKPFKVTGVEPPRPPAHIK